MKAVHKYTLEMTLERQNVPMPIGAWVVTVGLQGDQPRLWALVDPEQPKEDLTFQIVATGQTLPEAGLIYIGTMHDSRAAMPLVWHIFQILKGTA